MNSLANYEPGGRAFESLRARHFFKISKLYAISSGYSSCCRFFIFNRIQVKTMAYNLFEYLVKKHDCMDAEGRVTQGAVTEAVGSSNFTGRVIYQQLTVPLVYRLSNRCPNVQ